MKAYIPISDFIWNEKLNIDKLQKYLKGKPEIYYSSCISLKIFWGHKLDSIVGASIVGTGLW